MLSSTMLRHAKEQNLEYVFKLIKGQITLVTFIFDPLYFIFCGQRCDRNLQVFQFEDWFQLNLIAKHHCWWLAFMWPTNHQELIKLWYIQPNQQISELICPVWSNPGLYIHLMITLRIWHNHAYILVLVR